MERTGHYSVRETSVSQSDSKLNKPQDAQRFEKADEKTARNVNVTYVNQSQADSMKPDEENTYQPLIQSHLTLSEDSKVYQSLTLPKTVNIPPTLPPEPGEKCTLKCAQSSV